MHRFRKKSDAKRSQAPDFVLSAAQQDTLPPLPPTSDFRTSLILSDLTRRFSVLRSSSGTPIGLDDLKSKFAEQRAKGVENQVSEEEEEMILEALGRFHARTARMRGSVAEEATEDASARTLSTAESTFSDTRSSALPGSMSTASLSSGKGSQLSRRMSNNLFGSGKFRDHTYIRGAAGGQGARRTGRTVTSVTPSESTASTSSMTGLNTSMYADSPSLRPVTPDGSMYTTSAPSSPNNDKIFEREQAAKSAPLDMPSEYHPATSVGLVRALSPDRLKRASMALDAVIRELEEEGDDEIVMERSPITYAPTGASMSSFPRVPPIERDPSTPLPSPSDYGTALSVDSPVTQEDMQPTSLHIPSRTASPIPRLPGYIPGMPRPMTPRESTLDADDQTPSQTPSATPRATSPRLPGASTPSSVASQSFVSGMYRSNSTASTSYQPSRPISPQSPVGSTSPLFFSRSTNGRFTPEARTSNVSPSPDNSDVPGISRRWHASPLSGPAYQPISGISTSRPGTPSNVTWNMTSSPSSQGRNGSSISGHSRSGSSVSTSEHSNTDMLERNMSMSRSMRSPALPDSPWVDSGHPSNVPSIHDAYRPPSTISGMELGSPLQGSNRSLHSPTPTHNTNGGMRSPTSPTFSDRDTPTSINGHAKRGSHSASRRSSKQNPPNTTFSLSNTLLSPIANSSRSSLESAGSSYHSWDEEHKKDRLYGLFSGLDSQHAEWHDIDTLGDKSSSSTPGTSPYDGVESQEIVRRQTGLMKSDFVAIQDKLVSVALTKAATPENRNRASSIRRRRPSTSQSNYSYVSAPDNRGASPAPQPQSPVISPSRLNSDNHAKASALLDSVVDSIQSPPSNSADLSTSEQLPAVVQAPTDPEFASPVRRHRALADALFGADDADRSTTPSQTPLIIVPSDSEPVQEEQPVSVNVEPSLSSDSRTLTRSLSAHDGAPTIATWSPSTSMSPYDHVDAIDLALEVQRRAEAATAALRKSPSIPKISDAPHGKKRISPNQISSPTLVSASTSVDTIPLRSPSATPGASLHQSAGKTSRFKKLRGTLRAKQSIHNGEEVTPFPMDLKNPIVAHSAARSTSTLPTSEPTVSSATESGRFKVPAVPIASPPTSAGPSIKGFMARFRKQRASELSTSESRGFPSTSVTSSATLASLSFERPSAHQAHSAPSTKSSFAPLSPVSYRSSRPQSPLPQTITESPAELPSNVSAGNDEAALAQLFAAATNLGLDQAALNDLIARSPSTSSKSTAWTRLTRNVSVTDSRKSHIPEIRKSFATDRTRSDGRRSVDSSYSPRPSTDTRHMPGRKPVAEVTPRVQRGEGSSSNAIVRRTIIYPSDTRASTIDVNALMRKNSASRRRRSAGASSVHSTRSIHDRAPTPPPPHRTGGAKRFSNDLSPPVPNLPPSFSTSDNYLQPPGPMEKSSSAYDSLYDMYAGDSRTGSAINPDTHGASSSHITSNEPIPESVPAVEVIEMANGETIWSIVNGLRDDDAESFYGDRASFTSEYSLKDSEGVKVSFKEHGKKPSKGSVASFLSPRKQVSQPQHGSNRPETKVFFSSSAQIGRLIENLSRGTDAGSFNITPEHTQSHVGHSVTSSVGSEADARWTVEERLDQMLGSMAAH